MGIHENFERASKINREDEKRLLEKHDLLSKDKLQKVIKTKMKTSFIGALSAVELSFEELWKINPSDDDYDIKEKQLSCRTIKDTKGYSLDENCSKTCCDVIFCEVGLRS